MFELWLFVLWIFIFINTLQLFIYTIAIGRSVYICKKRSRYKKNLITFNGYEDWEAWPRVSIIKPIVSDEQKVKRLLETYFQLDYPFYDIHFCFQSVNHSCIEFVNQLSQKYPKIKVYVHAEPLQDTFGNRKIMNISRACVAARGELLWVADQNIHAHITSLKEMVSQFDDKDVGCVHQIPMWKCRDSIEHIINMTYFSSHHSRFYLFSDALRIICVSGMSMMFDKDKLTEIGGMQSFERFLSEDYAVAVALTHRGYKVKVAPSPAIQDPSCCSIRLFIDRMIRWTRLRFNIHFFLTLFEPFIHPLLYSLVSAFCIYYLIGFPFIFGFLLFIFGSFLADQVLMNLLSIAFPEHGPLPSFPNRTKAFFVLQFFIIPYIFMSAIIHVSRVSWHDIVYNLTWNTIILKPNGLETKQNAAVLKRFRRFKQLNSHSNGDLDPTCRASTLLYSTSDDNIFLQKNEPLSVSVK